jgi:hypothetical protein
MANPDDPPRPLTTDEMLARAQQHEPDITSRVLEEFRTQGVVPATQRIGQQGKTPIYGYPAGAERQLDVLLQWRQVEKNYDWLRVLMWVELWPIDLARVHKSLIKLSRLVRDTLAREGLLDDPAARAATARQLANRRGKNTLITRRRGVSVQQRAQTIHGILGTFLGGQAVAIDDPRAGDMLTALGADARKAARHNLPAFTVAGSPQPLFGDPNSVHLDRLVEAIETASDDELRRAQGATNLMVVRLPLMAVLTEAMTGGSGTPLDLLARNRDQPVVYLLSVALFIVLNRAGVTTDLQAIGKELEDMPEMIDKLSALANMNQQELEAELADDPKRLAALRRILANIPLSEVMATHRRQRPPTRRTPKP